MGGELKAENLEEKAEPSRVGAFLSNQKETVGAEGGDKGGAGDRESRPVTPAWRSRAPRLRCFCAARAVDSETGSSNGLCKSTESAHQ